jgi:uncharacterized protein YbaP (TraB family)
MDRPEGVSSETGSEGRMGILPIFLATSIAASPLPDAVPAAAPLAAQPSVSHPALWVVNDSDTIIYLFGTFHALDGRQDWFEQSVKTAFSASDQLMLETLVPEPAGAPAAPPAPVLTGQPKPVVTLAPSASSLLASSRTVMSAGHSQGMSTDLGADAILRQAAERSGKEVGGLESFQFQLNMFNSLQDAPKASVPDAKTMQALAQMLAQLEKAWSRGDLDSFTPMLMQMRSQSPETYKTMFVERNAKWARWIANRLKSPGIVFVAVGAGHLSGPDSVQNQLAALGVKSARIN